jgi:hypothetical protein
VRQRLDAITCLIPLLGKPEVGLQAKEALLLAVSMHDRRVDRFILTETNLPTNIVKEMVRKFGVCVAASVTFVPITPAASGISRGEIAAGAPDLSYKSSIVSFMKVLKFCAAFVSAASDQGVSEEFDGYMNIMEDPSCASLQATVCDHYRILFLRECVRPALLENGEQQVLVVQSIFRSMLLELSPSQNRRLGDPTLSSLNSSAAQLLCTPTTALICEDRELLQAIFPRAGGVSRSVSISTLQLLSTLLGAASMRESCRLILSPEEAEGGNGGSKGNPGEQSPATPSKSLDIDTTLNKVISGAATKFGSIPWVGRCNGQGVRENCSTNYMEAGLDRILSRLAGGIQCQGAEALLQIDPTMFPVTGSRPVGGPLLELTKRKLASFLTLKYDEQVAVTGLVEMCVTMLSTLLVLSGSDPMGNILLKFFIGLFESVSERVTELANHMKSFADAEQKLEIICAVLNDPNCDQRYRRLIEKESTQVVRILETSLIVRELYREFEGSLLAVRQLRLVLIPQGSVGGLISNTTSPSNASSHFTTPHSQHSNSRSPVSLSPFFSHSSPFSHVVHSSIHLSSQEQGHLCYSDSDSEEEGDEDHAADGEGDGEEGEGPYALSDEDLEERFLHECSLFERDLDLILKDCEEEEDQEEEAQQEEQQEEEQQSEDGEEGEEEEPK